MLPGQSTGESTVLPVSETTIRQIHLEIDSLYKNACYNEGIEKIEALSYYYQQRKDIRGEIQSCNLMGDFLRALGDLESSRLYLEKSLLLNSMLKDDILSAKIYNLIAATYFQSLEPGHSDSSEIYCERSLRLARKIRDNKLIYSNLNIYGTLQFLNNRPEEALMSLTEALGIARAEGTDDEALILLNMARVYDLKGDLKHAGELALSSFGMAKKKGITMYIRLSSDFLRNLYIRQGNKDKAYYFLNELNKVSEVLFMERAEKKIRDMEFSFHSREMQKENERLKSEDAINKKKLIQRRINSILLSVLVVLAFAFILIFYRQKKRLKRSNLELLTMNQEIRRQKEATEKLAQELDTANATLKKFISIIAHDLKNPFNTIIGFSDLLNTEFDTLAPEERKLAIENTHRSAVSAYTLLEQLLSWARLQTGVFKPNIITINIYDLIADVVNLLQASAMLKKQRLVKNVPVNLNVRGDRNMILAVFRNLLSNAIKFTPEEGTITFSARASDGMVIISVTDTGIGIPEKELGKIFSMEEPFMTPGTAGEKGSGMGLLICREYLEKNFGTITVTSREGGGTAFEVSLPGI